MSQIFVLVGQSSLQTLEMVFFCGCFALYYKSDWNFSASDFESGFKPDCKCLAFFSVYHFDDCAFSAFTPYAGDKHWNRSYDYSA